MTLIDRFIQKYSRLPTEVDPEYLEMLRMSKYQILDVPTFSPGKCANCGASSNDGRKYIDIGLEIPWYGIFYLCGLCLQDIAHNFGCFEGLQEELNTARARAAAIDFNLIKQQGDKLEEAVLYTFKEVKEYFDNLRTIGDNSSSDGDPSMGTVEKSSKSGVSETKPRAIKSTTSSRSENIPSLTSLIDKTK